MSRFVLATLAVALLTVVTPTGAEDSISDFPEIRLGDFEPIDPAGSDANGNACCDSGCCGGGGWLSNADLRIGFDAWTARLDDDGANNFGARTAINKAFDTCKCGVMGQVGVAYGIYDWDGHEMGQTTDNEEQVFVTAGAYRRGCGCGDYTWGVIWDYLHDENIGQEHNQAIDMHQVRFRFGYGQSECSELGVRGSLHVHDGKGFETGIAGTIQVRPLDHVSLYYQRTLACDATVEGYIGWMEEPGELMLGVEGEVPINSCLNMYGIWMYGKPSTHPGDIAPNGVDNSYSEAYWTIAWGFVYYPGGCDCCGDTPLLPVADNSTFLVKAPVGSL